LRAFSGSIEDNVHAPQPNAGIGLARAGPDALDDNVARQRAVG